MYFEEVKASEEIKTYIRQADAALVARGYTEHGFAHCMRCADLASRWLLQLGYDERLADLAKIAGYMHDIGNLVNRDDHAQSGAIMAFDILTRMGLPPADTAEVAAAIGHHDEATAYPVSALAAVLILADKTDVRRSRVRTLEHLEQDIHDRVNYAVERATTSLDTDASALTLRLEIDTAICTVMDYFEIFFERMNLCRQAAAFFNMRFQLDINGTSLM